MFLDRKLDFDENTKGIFGKTSNSIGLICKLWNFINLQIYKTFVWLDLDYGDIVYHKASIGYFQQKLKPIQYNAVLAITGATRGTSREKVYSALCLVPLQKVMVQDVGTENYILW